MLQAVVKIKLRSHCARQRLVSLKPRSHRVRRRPPARDTRRRCTNADVIQLSRLYSVNLPAPIIVLAVWRVCSNVSPVRTTVSVSRPVYTDSVLQLYDRSRLKMESTEKQYRTGKRRLSSSETDRPNGSATFSSEYRDPKLEARLSDVRERSQIDVGLL